MEICGIKENKAIANGAWLLLGSFSSKLLAFVLGIFTARLLGPEDLGLISYGTSYAGFFGGLCALGLSEVLVDQLIRKPEREGEALGSALTLRLFSAGISILLIFALTSWADAGEPGTKLVVLFCSFSLLFQAFDTLIYWFQAKLMAKYSSLILLISYAVMAIYKILLLLWKQDVLLFALASSVEYVTLAVLILWIYRRKQGQKLRFSFQRSKELLQAGGSFLLSGMLVAIYANTDKLMLKQMLDETAVGHYALAVNFSSLWAFGMTALISAFAPVISHLHEEKSPDYERRNRQLYAIVFYVSAALSLTVSLLAEPLILLLYGEAYLPAAEPLRIVVWYTAFSYLGGARALWLVCEKKQSYVWRLSLLSVLLNVALNGALIPKFGTAGAAWASLLTQISTIVVWPLIIPALRPNAKLMLDGILLKNMK